MVIKTDLCAFSEFRIYPGHGQRFIRRDGQPMMLSTSKCKHLMHDRKKPSKLTWTQSWRRLNKKSKEEGTQKKRSRRSVKVSRAIVGASLDELKKKRLVSKPKSAATEAALEEVKARAKAAGAKTNVAANKTANMPKVQKPTGANRGSVGVGRR